MVQHLATANPAVPTRVRSERDDRKLETAHYLPVAPWNTSPGTLTLPRLNADPQAVGSMPHRPCEMAPAVRLAPAKSQILYAMHEIIACKRSTGAH